MKSPNFKNQHEWTFFLIRTLENVWEMCVDDVKQKKLLIAEELLSCPASGLLHPDATERAEIFSVV